MAKVTFYPLGNADSTLLELADGRLLLHDYCSRKDSNDEEDKRTDLAAALKDKLKAKNRDSFDVVAFTHGDDDHVGGAEEFFWLAHTDKYQGDGRIKIEELWVPACFLLETGLDGSAKIVRQEARHRLKEGKNIRVFGNPGVLDDWLKNENIDPATRSHLISHAGALIPDYDAKPTEIFLHSPFSYKMENSDVDRNGSCLVLHVTFFEGDSMTRLMLGADTPCEAWDGIVWKTRRRNRKARLEWDIFRVSHHCSSYSLAEDKGKTKTAPTVAIESLFGEGTKNCILISSSDQIPSGDTEQPPHFQAAAYYGDVAKGKSGQFLVTMETPNPKQPDPIVIDVTDRGPLWRKAAGIGGGVSGIASRRSPRLG